ncbi:methyl esterase 1 [Rhynchospora pubera]|uniref:Methyl esterase 1 n=1 Tax=Rhynchospora pubera TaxID=906938 RepID=A0AAV8CFF9_9POAL|nr:methyl esterase 1 [Rhynchospora pubera]
MEINNSSKHMILIHGACHGAWSWYKVTTQLQTVGYHVTVLDMAASGRDPRQIAEVPSFRDYSQPLLDILGSLPPEEKVILVGHSLGGVNIALAMEEFPEKIAAGVFLSAFMPDSDTPPSHVIDKYREERPLSAWMDTEFKSVSSGNKILTSMFFGPGFMKSKLYQLCSPQDFTLGMSLVRVSSLFLEDLRLQKPFSKDRFGSVNAVYIVCSEDKGIPLEYQQSMITSNGLVKEVKTIKSDHMAMLSAPEELSGCLMEIADKYA